MKVGVTEHTRIESDLNVDLLTLVKKCVPNCTDCALVVYFKSWKYIKNFRFEYCMNIRLLKCFQREYTFMTIDVSQIMSYTLYICTILYYTILYYALCTQPSSVWGLNGYFVIQLCPIFHIWCSEGDRQEPPSLSLPLICCLLSIYYSELLGLAHKKHSFTEASLLSGEMFTQDAIYS